MRDCIAGDQPNADFFVHPGRDAVNVGGDGFALGGRVEAEHEDLVFVDAAAFVWKAAENRGTAGGECKALPALERLAVERREAGLEREAATHARGQVAIEVVNPVPGVGPAAFSFFGTVDLEGIELARLAERHHRLRDARADLAHAPAFALR